MGIEKILSDIDILMDEKELWEIDEYLSMLSLDDKKQMRKALLPSSFCPLYKAAICDDDELVKLLLPFFGEDTYYFNKEEGEIFSVLYAAVENSCFAVTKLLLEVGADVHIGKKGVTPLTLAIIQSDEKLSSLLLDYGADSNITKEELLSMPNNTNSLSFLNEQKNMQEKRIAEKVFSMVEEFNSSVIFSTGLHVPIMEYLESPKVVRKCLRNNY